MPSVCTVFVPILHTLYAAVPLARDRKSGHVHRVPRLLHHCTPFASPQAIPNSAEIKRAQPSATIRVRKVAGVNRKPLQAQGLTSGEPPPSRIGPQHVGVSNEGVNVITATPTLPLVGILRKCVTLSRSFGLGLVEVLFPNGSKPCRRHHRPTWCMARLLGTVRWPTPALEQAHRPEQPSTVTMCDSGCPCPVPSMALSKPAP